MFMGIFRDVHSSGRGCAFTLEQFLLSQDLSQPWLAVQPVVLQFTELFSARPSELSENSSSQRNSLEEGIKSEHRTNSMSG